MFLCMDAELGVLGPLAWLDPTTEDIKLIGAVSWGHPGNFCLGKYKSRFNCTFITDCVLPGVFAELTTVLDWIKQITGDCNEKTCGEGNCMTWDKLHPDAKIYFTNLTAHAL